MNEQLSKQIEESIKLELNVAELYNLFATAFREDFDFWQELCWEEKHHAHLIRTMKKPLLSSEEFPKELLSYSLENLIEVNNTLKSLIKKYNNKPPSRKDAFNIAISIEKSAGEIHYQHAMDVPFYLNYMEIWQKLNEDDKNHVKRISAYMRIKRIESY